MRRIAAVIMIAVLVISFAGCGGGSDESASSSDAVSLLLASTQAMSELNGYRMSGSISLGMEGDAAGGQDDAISMDVDAEIQNSDGEMRQHMFVSMSGYEVEAYIIGGVYYQNVPGQGWQKSSVAANQMQGLSLGMVDAAQMEMMAGTAKASQIFEEDDETVALSIQLDQDYFQASMDLYYDYIEETGQQVPEGWDEMVGAITDFQAEIRIWVTKPGNLFKRMEMTYKMSGLPQVGTVTSSMDVDFSDYDEDIAVELPPEVEQAPEIELTQ
ncbi:MAG: hypothetical protein JW854_17730 [Actinobacteria bacterium]|nr:hypothetical protein [Actinomycetota bacterium]